MEGQPFPRVDTTDTKVIRDSLQDLPSDTFTMGDLFTVISEGCFYEEIPKPTLSFILSRMAKDGEIEVVTPGAGRRSTIYKRIT